MCLSPWRDLSRRRLPIDAARERDEQVALLRVHGTPPQALESCPVEPGAQGHDRVAVDRLGEAVEVFDDEQASAVLQRAYDLRERGHRSLRVGEQSIRGRSIEERRGERQRMHVAPLQLAM